MSGALFICINVILVGNLPTSSMRRVDECGIINLLILHHQIIDVRLKVHMTKVKTLGVLWDAKYMRY